MTRENKLALIIGFTLILMVGVLVSDHLSRARAVTLEEAGQPEPDLQAEHRAFSGSLLTEAIDVAQERAARVTPPVAAQLTQGISPVNQTPPPSATIHDPVVIQQGAVEQAPTDHLAEATGVMWNRLSLSATPPTRERPVPTLESITQKAEASRPVSPPLTKDVKHRVETGESLYKIAERYLGNGNRWREIQRANAKAVSPDGEVGVGVVLNIPILVDASARAAGPMPAAQPTAAPGRSAGAGRAYTVKPGDTLGEIAKDLLGSSRRAGEIVAANRGTLEDADSIQVGMVLKIPAR